ncbi:hypothetical protein BOX15_Mlig026757g1, partial [Macrostomum lignano]
LKKPPLDQMASVDELKSALKENLESRGVLQDIRASLRAEIYRSLEEPRPSGQQRPGLSNENLLINELIREYLEFNEYSNAASVLAAESGQPQARLSRSLLSRELNLREDPSCQGMPLLYSMLAYYMNRGVASGGRGVRFGQQQHDREEDGGDS